MEQISILNLDTPCYIFDQREFVKSIRGFQHALSNNFESFIIGYSVKTNSVPYCLVKAKELGAFAEVVSYDEYNLVILCGFPKNRIIYNGPMKSRETFIDAIQNGAIVNIESHRELEWLKYLPLEGQYKVGIRLNINISDISPEDADSEDDNSRFGFSDSTEEFSQVLEFINTMPNVTLSGLHIHRTTSSRSVGFYTNAINYTCKIILKYYIKVDYLDIGGGFFGIFANKPTYQHYSDAFKRILHDYSLDNLTIIVEPGNALTASSFSFLSEVIDVKHVAKDKWFVTTDGSRHDIDPFYKKSSYMIKIYSDEKGKVVSEQIVSGCTCLERDRMFILKNKRLLNIGDKIYYKNVGAYTLCLTPLFIRYIPNIYLKRNNNYSLIRQKWTEKEFIQKSSLK